jgi:ornithine--oxo-acid transaminase
MVEPIQGEAGVIIPPQGYLKDAKSICEENNIVLILDEIQTGLGRTGKLLAEEHDGIEADLTLIGKALSGGYYPISAVLSNKEVMDVLRPGEHGSTFGGNPLACAVARTAIKVLIEERMIENSATMGEYFLSGLAAIKSDHIKDVRGKGLMLAVELVPEAGGARKFSERLMAHGLLCKDTHENTLRIAPPLVIMKEEIDWALEKLELVLCAQ